MTEAAASWLAELSATLPRLVSEQPEAVNAAAELFAATVAAGGVVHVHDTGHMIGFELVARTGGFVAFSRLEYTARVSSGGVAREQPAPLAPGQAALATAQLVTWLLGQGTIRSGDVLLLSSVSGVSVPVVELALQARERGIPVVALTSRAFSAALPARHPSGRRLLDAADVVLDDLAPYGDATRAFDGLDARVAPLSGVAGAALMWSVVVQTTALLLDRGVTPSIYPSINLPDGPERVDAVERRYRETGQ